MTDQSELNSRGTVPKSWHSVSSREPNVLDGGGGKLVAPVERDASGRGQREAIHFLGILARLRVQSSKFLLIMA